MIICYIHDRTIITTKIISLSFKLSINTDYTTNDNWNTVPTNDKYNDTLLTTFTECILSA